MYHNLIKTSMLRKTLIFASVFISLNTSAQIEDEILAEGKLLFRLEKASWNSTDDFLSRFPGKREITGGYVSYESDNHKITTIFFSQANNDSLLVRYEFDVISDAPLKIDTAQLEITALEKDLIEMRRDANNQIISNSDNFFTFYKNTSLNLIPVITEKERRVFILTGPQVSDVVIIGNDYLLEYNKKNKLTAKKKIHNSMLQYPYKSDDPENPLKSTFHSHVLSEYISSTDICTLLLYKNYVEWKQHYVVSKKYISVFDMEKESLLILTKKAWDKINEHQKNSLSE